MAWRTPASPRALARGSRYACRRSEQSGASHGLDIADLAEPWVGRAAPIVDRRRIERQPAVLTRILLGELLHAVTVFDGDPVGIEDIEEDAFRRRMPAGAADDRNVVVPETPQGLSDIVDFRNHEIDVVEASLRAVVEAD